jgi:hypothetical protein
MVACSSAHPRMHSRLSSCGGGGLMLTSSPDVSLDLVCRGRFGHQGQACKPRHRRSRLTLAASGAQLTYFPSTKVQILTQRLEQCVRQQRSASQRRHAHTTRQHCHIQPALPLCLGRPRQGFYSPPVSRLFLSFFIYLYIGQGSAERAARASRALHPLPC